MKKVVAVSGMLLFCAIHSFAQNRKCGQEILKDAIIANDPANAEKLKSITNGLEQDANNYYAQQASGNAEKTTGVSAIPVIFHIIVNSTQFTDMGGYAGIQARVDSQIDIINRDFNRGNADSTLIPAGFKPASGGSARLGSACATRHCDW